MLNLLKNFDAERMDVDELVALSLFARQLHGEYETLNLDVPDWVDESTRGVRLEIRSRVSDLLAKRLKEAKARRASLRTTEEKRTELDAEIEKLEKLHAGSGV